MTASQLPSKIKFHYIKGNLFRVIRVEGAIGGVTPGREIFVSLFNERGALPKMIEYAVSPTGQLGAELGRESKEGLVREMEVGVLMSATAAKTLAEYLLQQVKLINESEPMRQSDSVSGEKIQ